MAKTFLVAVLTFCVQTSFAESFEDLKTPPAASQWTEAAKEIGLDAIIKKSEKDPNAAKAGKVSFTFKGNGFGATPKFPLVPSDKESGHIVYTGIPRDKLVRADSETNRKLFQNILVEVLTVANSKDEQKANAAKLVASELLRVQYGKTLEQIAPRKVADFAGASGILGKGKGKGKGGLHLGGDLGLSDGQEDGHAELPEAAPEARLLSYLQDPKAWVPATECIGTECKQIPGQIMNPKLGGNLAIDGTLAAAFAGKDKPSATTPVDSPDADAWLLAKLKAAKAAGKKRILIKFGDDKICDPCRKLTAALKKLDPGGESYIVADVGTDSGAHAAYWKYNEGQNSIPMALFFDVDMLADNATTPIEPVELTMENGTKAKKLHGLISDKNLRSLLKR